MKWRGRRKSTHVTDRRGEAIPRSSGSNAAAGLLLGFFFRSSRKTKLAIILVAIFAFTFFRGPMMEMIGLSELAPTEQSHSGQNDEMRDYLSVMMADNETVWTNVLAKQGLRYRPANMIIYSQRTQIPGGIADARMGPFYLPANETIYIDPSFFSELKEKFGAKGDFAEAYVVAHEYGHHIQNIMGRLQELHTQRGTVSKKEYNQHSVRVELQADFLAGVFAHHANNTFKEFLEAGDIEEAMRCAEAIGDDRLQQQSQGSVVRDSFTHGTSKQRAYWFQKGYTTGDLKEGEKLYTLPYSQL
ncbi:neutral zinc metallopeptidase [Rubritalea tangerina]|uniref:Neutral zinc metallopeptidase n=1 Tax=Rubritalea tangerina TaxID=430798 RepID=A0ABW4Z5X7_9BACT